MNEQFRAHLAGTLGIDDAELQDELIAEYKRTVTDSIAQMKEAAPPPRACAERVCAQHRPPRGARMLARYRERGEGVGHRGVQCADRGTDPSCGGIGVIF